MIRRQPTTIGSARERTREDARREDDARDDATVDARTIDARGRDARRRRRGNEDDETIGAIV